MFNARCAETIIDSLCLEAKEESKEKVKFRDCNLHKSRSAMTWFSLFDFLQILRRSCVAWSMGCSGRRSLDWGAGGASLRAMLLYLCPHMFAQSHGDSSRPWSGWLSALWDGFGTTQAARLEERSGMDDAGRVRLFFLQHFWSEINWRCWCSCNLALSVGLQEISTEMRIKYWG